MTRRDVWKKRKCVTVYREWADKARDCANMAGGVPEAHLTETIEIIATYQPPPSWSAKKKNAAMGMRKRTAPDPDNCGKSVLDSLWPDGDQAVGRLIVDRFWGLRDQTVVTITLV